MQKIDLTSQVAGVLPIKNGGTGSSSSGSGTTVAWGSITGTLSSQGDLQAALNGKQATGSYLVASNNLTDVGSAATALSNLSGVPTSRTVNGHSLSGDVIVSASDITTGTLPHAQLPALVGGDIPNNSANTTGTALGLSGVQTANYIYAAPSGSAGTATFRAMTQGDMPAILDCGSY